jgi:hypothetical protein
MSNRQKEYGIFWLQNIVAKTDNITQHSEESYKDMNL